MSMESAAEVTAKSPPDRPAPANRKTGQKSKVANGALLQGVDGRLPWIRRAKEVLAEHLSDFGGVANTTAAERSIIRRVSALTVELERLEAKFAVNNAATDSDLDLYQRTASAVRRLLETIGVRGRRPVDVTPRSLREQLDAEVVEPDEVA